MSVFVLIHGGWHTGEHLQPVARHLQHAGHEAHTPTLLGHRPGDRKDVSLGEVIDDFVEHIERASLSDFILVGHSYAGMVMSGAAGRLGARIRRLVYWNAFVPLDGECLNDMVPPHYRETFDALTAADGGVMLPFPIWREAFINDADLDLARQTYDSLNPHPARTFNDPISLKTPLAELTVGKSYINGTEDTALPGSLGWHPRLSERLGLFRLVQIAGSHGVCFTDPARLARAIEDAGRD